MKNLSKQPSSLGKFWNLGWQRKVLLFEALAVLSAYKLLLFVVPFRYFVTADSALKNKQQSPADSYLRDVIRAIQVVSNRVPFGFTCLVQALAAKWLLRHTHDVQVRIGVQKSADRGFVAHAWITHNGKTILGEQAGQVFEPILEWK